MRVFYQGFKAGDNVEQFLVDTALTQAVERTVQVFQQFVDILFGTLHWSQSARVFTFPGFRACPEPSNDTIL